MLLAEQLVGEARERRPRGMAPRERFVLSISAGCFVAAVCLIAALMPSDRETGLLLVAGLVVAYALVSRVRFEFANWFVVPEQLVFIPMLMLAPLPYLPALVAAGAVLAMLPDFFQGTWHRDRWLSCLSDSWFSIGPVLVLALFAPGEPQVALAWAYALAFLAQVAFDLTWTIVRDRLTDALPLRTTIVNYAGVARFDALLTPVAFAITVPAAAEPVALLAIAPLVWMLEIFSRDRRERYGKTLELHRAYRGTVQLLSDVVEFDDPYTAHHSRSLVEVAESVADHLGVAESERRHLEFAVLLHDVGKIAIPKDVLNKPGSLTSPEYELMKTHTIEGQFMLDRVGGLLGDVGEIVRSSHERWDGTGYPDGLAGEEIPIASRIVFACDAYSAMTTDRVYRKAMSQDEALAELAANAGTQFDPRVVAGLTKVVKETEPMLSRLEGNRSSQAAPALQRSVGAGAA